MHGIQCWAATTQAERDKWQWRTATSMVFGTSFDVNEYKMSEPRECNVKHGDVQQLVFGNISTMHVQQNGLQSLFDHVGYSQKHLLHLIQIIDY